MTAGSRLNANIYKININENEKEPYDVAHLCSYMRTFEQNTSD